MDNNQDGQKTPTAFLVDLVSNRKIPVATPRCRVGRDDLNDIVISGDQSISRFHFIISYENDEFTVQDAKSRHGTFLNGNQLTSPESIKDGDVLKVGVSLFWFVVEQADKAGGDAGPKVGAIEGQEDAQPVELKKPQEGDKPTPGAKGHTQEIAKPDAGLIEKLEQAANSIQIEEKPTGKASLASLLSPLADNNSKDEEEDVDDVKAKLAARDAELLKEIESAAESPAKVEEVGTATTDSAAVVEEKTKFPEKILNKPSDTVTIEALQKPDGTESSLTQEAPESEVKAEEPKKEEGKVIEPPKIALGNLLAHAETQREEEEKERKQAEEAEQAEQVEVQAAAEPSKAEEKEQPKEEDTNGKVAAGTNTTPEPEKASGDSEKELIKEQSQTGEISVNTEKEIASTAGPSMTEEEAAFAEARIETAEPSQQAAVETERTEVAAAQAEPQENGQDRVISAGASAVPDWCKRYFSDEIGKLNKELDELNDQVKLAQQKIRDVETRVALTRGIRNTLLTTTGDELVEACGKVLGLLGWKVTIAADDKNELRLEVDDKHVCIARVIWTTTQAERSHLGQLSISQTRYWCEKGVEPKGILLVSKIGDGPPQAGGNTTEDQELQEYAAKKNVCLMTTLQLLALYKEVALGDAKPDNLRAKVAQSNGWLEGFDLEPGTTEPNEKDEVQGNKLSSLLSA